MGHQDWLKSYGSVCIALERGLYRKVYRLETRWCACVAFYFTQQMKVKVPPA
jgi:hypothetical protein